jgi:hypothetical protein
MDQMEQLLIAGLDSGSAKSENTALPEYPK